ncbi:MAG: phosphate acyltransferase, partial [Clostridia bacterium]|nr:phosphate acyltransferase [Clostridia bacterium]
MVKIIVDAMGGDNAPAATVEGSVTALNNDKDLYIILAGRQEDINAELRKYKYDASRLEILDCRDTIDMNDVPTTAIHRKEASLVKAFWTLKKEDDVAALVTAGSTGATIVGGQTILG